MLPVVAFSKFMFLNFSRFAELGKVWHCATAMLSGHRALPQPKGNKPCFSYPPQCSPCWDSIREDREKTVCCSWGSVNKRKDTKGTQRLSLVLPSGVPVPQAKLVVLAVGINVPPFAHANHQVAHGLSPVLPNAGHVGIPLWRMRKGKDDALCFIQCEQKVVHLLVFPDGVPMPQAKSIQWLGWGVGQKDRKESVCCHSGSTLQE